MSMSNQEFAERMGYHHTMASRVRNGHRLPSVEKLAQIRDEFGLELEKLVEAHNAGPARFSALLRAEIFNKGNPE